MKIVYTLQTGRKAEGAAFNRVDLLVKGLNANSVKCKLILYKSSPVNGRVFNFLWTCLTLIRMCFTLITLSRKDVFVIYGEYLLLNYITKIPHKAKLIIERNEYSTHLIRNNLSHKHIAKINKFENSLSHCDGIITCSTYLKDYYSKFTNAPIAIIPLVGDFNKFKKADYPALNRVTYCGDFGGDKDGLPTLVEAFSKISKQYPQYKLYLIGDTSEDNTMQILQEKIKNLDIENQVVFTGRVKHDLMPKLLSDSAILVLARPANKQAEGGIPSKLAEYLATGRATLITKVGDLPLYFGDNNNIFFAIPDSVDNFAEKISYIIENPDVAKEVSDKGVQTVKQFDYTTQAKSLKLFFDKL